MRLFKSVLVAAALALASPVWAHGGHGDRHGGRHGHHHGWHDRGHHAGGHHGHRHRHHPHWKHRAERNYYYGGYYYPPYPAYGYVAPAPGVHIVIPLR